MDITMDLVSWDHIPIIIRTIIMDLELVIFMVATTIVGITVVFTVVRPLPVLTTGPVQAVQEIISLWREVLLLVRQDQLSEITAETLSSHVEERNVMVQVVLLPEPSLPHVLTV